MQNNSQALRIQEPVEEVVSRAADRLSDINDSEQHITPQWHGPLPSVETLRQIVDQLRIVLFPDFFDQLRGCRSMTQARLMVSVDRLYRLLSEEVCKCLAARNLRPGGRCPHEHGSAAALKLIDRLPELKRLLYTDVQAIYDNDPATDDYGEIILSYPVVEAMIHYRLAHEMVKLDIPVLPRMLTEMAHANTGIDINPGAQIGEYFAIDHGTGVVIGETCIIGNHVTIYQGVTLGAKNFTLDDEGRPVNLPRHPILEDNVTIYANSTILGRVTIGHDTVIGGNVWLTESVEPYSRVLQPPFTASNRITTRPPRKRNRI
ncbi:MAG: serine O-acetyltransferase [Muribaculaceae bacterium]|nr:serine O-acetyltransferase [Muribaculaceae bacterium]